VTSRGFAGAATGLRRLFGGRSLDSYVFIFYLLIFGGMLVIGGASLLMVQSMMDKTLAIRGESRDMEFVNHLHNKTYSLLIAIHNMQVFTDGKYARMANDLANEIDAGLTDYLQHEIRSPNPEGLAEVTLLRQLRDYVQSLHKITKWINEHSGEMPLTSDTLGHWDEALNHYSDRIQGLVKDINRLHFDVMGHKVETSRHNMNLITQLYMIAALGGLALVYGGYRLHSRHVVRPVVQLAEAARKIAAGDLTTRVRSGSRTEIGLLYESFNAMVERLQTDAAELAEFNQHLEGEVEKRSRELEAVQNKLSHLEKMAMLGQIATSVNHEVRTPLNVLSMNVQLIGRLMSGCSEQCLARKSNVAERIARVDSEIQRVSDMLEEFVHYARLTPVEKKPLELNRLLGYVAEMISEKAAQAKVAVTVEPAAAPLTVPADEHKLIQVLVNLCTNALQAMPEAGGTLHLTARPIRGGAQIIVADTGKGIAGENLDKIFLPFFTTKSAGLGLGLAIVQRIVEDHGGTIVCRSTPGDGTTFTVTLPGMAAVTDAVAAAAAPEEPAT